MKTQNKVKIIFNQYGSTQQIEVDTFMAAIKWVSYQEKNKLSYPLAVLWKNKAYLNVNRFITKDYIEDRLFELGINYKETRLL